jgi:predicted secreted protein
VRQKPASHDARRYVNDRRVLPAGQCWLQIRAGRLGAIAAVVTALSMFAMFGLPAWAGDGAASNIIGFSADGRYFAFEQYGEEDGSGAPYAEIAVIDIGADRFVTGTPIAGASREEAMARAAAILQRLAITQNGNEVGEVAASRAREVITPKDMNRLMDDAVADMALAASAFGVGARVTLQTADVEAPHCRNLMLEKQPKGFALALELPGREATILHRDLSVPRSRGCPDHYGLAGAYALRTSGGMAALAALIEYFYVAFEGHNRRFVAVTAHLPRDPGRQ